MLEGGQDKDDQKERIFYNEIIASDEISSMLAPIKCLQMPKRYTKDGVEENITFKEDDNS